MKKCPSCGSLNQDAWIKCGACGTAFLAPDTAAPAPYVKDYLVTSILVTLCCCLPLGIVAIVFAAMSRSKLAAGDYRGAQADANTASTLCWVSFVLGILLAIGYALTD